MKINLEDPKSEAVFVEHMDEKSQTTGLEAIDVEARYGFTPKERARIQRRVDFRVVPIIGLMLGIALMGK